VNEGKRPLFLDPNLFLNRDALIHLLKYNEPLDWETAGEQPDSDDEDFEPVKKPDEPVKKPDELVKKLEESVKKPDEPVKKTDKLKN